METDSHRVEEFSETLSILVRSASVLPSVVNLIYSVCRNETVKHKSQRGNTGIYPQLFQVFRFKVNWWTHRGLWRKVRPMKGWAYFEEFIWWEEEFVFLTWVLRLKHRYTKSKGSILVDSSFLRPA